MKVYESSLQNKAESLHLKTRAEFRKNATEAFRKQLIKNLDNRLNDIIALSETNLTEDILVDLIYYANTDTQNAIIQLGNLMIDNGSLVDFLKDKLIPGKNEYWSWLIRIMLMNSPALGIQGLDWVVTNFLKKKMGIVMKKNLMETLVMMSLDQQLSEMLASNTQFIEQIYKSIQSNCEVTCKLGFTILSNLVSINDSITSSIILILRARLNQVLRVGFLKSECSIRELTSTILSNLVLNGLLPTNEIMDTVFLKSTKEREGVIEELSYFFVNASETLPLQLVEQLVILGLMETITFYLSSDSEVLVENGIQILKSILKRLSKEERGHRGFYNVLVEKGIIYLVDQCRKESQYVEETVEEYLLA